MVKVKLNDRNINRIVLLLLLVLPLVYLVGCSFAYLSADNAISINDFNTSFIVDLFGGSNFITSLGISVINGSALGFPPFVTFFRFINDNLFGFTGGLGAFLLGYCFYASHVVALDLVAYILLFIPRLIKKIVSLFERGSKND